MKLKKQKAIFMIYLIIAMSFSLWLIAPEVEAQEAKACCEKTKDDEYCLYTDVYDCNPAYKRATTTCEQTSYCELGCCYSDDTGQCFKNAPRTKCQEIGGTWTDDKICSIPQCQKGCCTISDQCSFITKTMCKRETSKFPYVSMLFDESITTEQECIDKCRSQELGACVYSDKSCTFTTRESCLEPRGEGKTGFHANMLCSHPELDTNCAKQQKTDCYQGKVYWIDSCGNRENIYMADKERSYNKGIILLEDRTCHAELDDSDCGNCDYSKGTLCGEQKGVATYGDFICKDINCKKTTESLASPDADGGLKRAGESWCLYESLVSMGMDTVGSRHHRVSCINGEEIIEQCADYREEMCMQNVFNGEPVVEELGSMFDLGEGYSEAMCKENRYEDCNSCNDLEKLEEKQECCTDAVKKDCYWMPMPWAQTSGFCIPLVAPGIRFWDTSAKETCSKVDFTCKVVYKKPRIGGSWKCAKNCECRTKEWVQAANQRCVSQGDCGAWYNVEGELSMSGFEAGGDSKMHKLTEKDITAWENITKPPARGSYHMQTFWRVAPAIVTAIAYYIIGSWAAGTATVSIGLIQHTVYTQLIESAGSILGEGAATATFGQAVLGFLSVVLLVVAIIWLIYSIINMISGRKRSKLITVTCNPWEPPDGGKDCEKCNKKYIDCTEYRCKSLGKQCELINEGTENEKCINMNPHDTTSPKIKAISPDYEIREIPYEGYEIKDEIPTFTPVTVGVNTNEPAQCRYSLNTGTPFDQMDHTFGDTLYLYNHTVTFSLPSILTEEEILKITNGGKYTVYIKCKDKAGNANRRDYYIKFRISTGPDLQSPKIEHSLIQNGAYIAADKDKIDLNVYLNEPASCRWSNNDVDYTAMTNKFICVDEEAGYDVGLYECSTTLDIVKEKVNNYFFRCLDKAGNVNTEAMPVDNEVPFTLIGTVPLEITSIEPSGKVYSSSPILSVKTEDGAQDGVAVCGWSERDEPIYNMIQFFQTNSTLHKQQLFGLTSRLITYHIKCIDRGGNIAETETTLDVEADLTAPIITQAYIDVVKNVLVLETSEKTTCEYASQSFSYGSGTSMVGTLTKQHKANMQDIFYVVCRDQYDNELAVWIYP